MIWCYGCDDEIIACTDEALAEVSLPLCLLLCCLMLP